MVQGTSPQQDAAALGSAIKETEREKQIRLGLITPFQNLPGFSRGVVRRTGAPLATLDHFSPYSTRQEPTIRTNQATKQVFECSEWLQVQNHHQVPMVKYHSLKQHAESSSTLPLIS